MAPRLPGGRCASQGGNKLHLAIKLPLKPVDQSLVFASVWFVVHRERAQVETIVTFVAPTLPSPSPHEPNQRRKHIAPGGRSARLVNAISKCSKKNISD